MPLHTTSAKATEHKHQPNLSYRYGASCRFLPSDLLDFVIKSFAGKDESPAIDLVRNPPPPPSDSVWMRASKMEQMSMTQ